MTTTTLFRRPSVDEHIVLLHIEEAALQHHTPGAVLPPAIRTVAHKDHQPDAIQACYDRLVSLQGDLYWFGPTHFLYPEAQADLAREMRWLLHGPTTPAAPQPKTRHLQLIQGGAR